MFYTLKNLISVIKFFCITFCVFWLFNNSSSWAIISQQLKLEKQDLSDLKRVQLQLNSAKTVQARFLQISSNGEFSEGSLFLKRPGKLRLVYDAPNPLLVVADGTYISFVDRELDEATTVFLSMTNAEILLRDKISFFGNDLIVTKFERSPGVLRITINKADKPLAGEITLIFSVSPYELKKWVVTDSHGITTTISLLESQFNIPIEKKKFIYVPTIKLNSPN